MLYWYQSPIRFFKKEVEARTIVSAQSDGYENSGSGIFQRKLIPVVYRAWRFPVEWP